MRTRSNSFATVASVAEPINKRLRLSSAGHREVVAVAQVHELSFLDEELASFKERILTVLEKTREMLAALGSKVRLDERSIMADFPSVDEMVAKLGGGGKPGDVFRLFLGDEWDALKEMSSALAEKNEGRIRTLRLKQQRDCLAELRKIVIDLTVCDKEEAGEQSALVNECTQVLQVVMDRAGMNGRGTMRRTGAAIAVAGVVAAEKQKVGREVQKRPAPQKKKRGKDSSGCCKRKGGSRRRRKRRSRELARNPPKENQEKGCRIEEQAKELSCRGR